MNRIGLIVAGVIGLITLIFEIIYRHDVHPYFMWHSMPIFDLIFGAIGGWALVVVSKGLGHQWLQRDETYYGDDQA